MYIYTIMMFSDILPPIVYTTIGFLFSCYLHRSKTFSNDINKGLREIFKSKIAVLETGDPVETAIPSNNISIQEELIIIDNHRDIIGEFYNDAVKQNKTKYTYHPLYINNKKYPLDVYSDNVIGLEVVDSKYDEKLSNTAIITDIIDVGGVDIYNRNKIIGIK